MIFTKNSKMTRILENLSAGDSEFIKHELEEYTRAANDLIKSEGKLKSLIHHPNSYILVLNRQHVIEYINRTVPDITPARVVGRRVYELIPPEYHDIARTCIESVFATGHPSEYETMRILPNELPEYFTNLIGPIVINNEIVSVSLFSIDNTGRRRAEKALVLSESKFKALFRQVADCILVAEIRPGSAPIIVEINKSDREFYGYSCDELIGSPVTIFERDMSEKRLQEILAQSLLGDRVLFETIHTEKDGNKIPVEVSMRRLDIREERSLVICVFRDISERIKIYEERQKNQRLESLAVLAGGIAHDFNNLLSGILGNVDLAYAHITKPSRVSVLLNNALSTIEQAKDLTKQLLTFSKGGAPIKKAVSIKSILENSQALALSGSNTLCKLNLQPDLYSAFADPNQLSQVMTNIFINAKQSMPYGGTIKVFARNRIVNQNERALLKAGKYVETSIIDEGAGIPTDIIDKVFDPFFTTKSNGTGLGLATCYSIIHKHDGEIDILSESGVGTTVQIVLPATTTSTLSCKNLSEPSAKMGGLVLLLDDVESVREVAKAQLKYFGFEVVCATTGKEAIAIYKREVKKGKRFSLALLDLTLRGGMSGVQAMSAIRKIDPGVLAVVTSGYADSPVLSFPESYGFDGKIMKPYRMADLGRVLRDVLGSKNGWDCSGN